MTDGVAFRDGFPTGTSEAFDVEGLNVLAVGQVFHDRRMIEGQGLAEIHFEH